MAEPSKQDLGNSLDLVDVKEIKQNVVILKDGSFRQIVMVSGVNFALKSESDQNIITQAYQTFVNGVDFPLQILIHSRKVNIDRYVETLLARKSEEQSPVLQNQIEEYASFIKGFVEKNAIMEKTFLVVVPFYPIGLGPKLKGASGISLPFMNKKKKPDAAAEADKKAEDEKTFAENLAQLGQRTSQVTNGLLGIGLEASVLEYEALVELFYNFYNPQTIEREKLPVPRE